MNKKKFENLPKWNDFALFNFLAKDKKNGKEVMDAARGYAVPGIVATNYETIEEAAKAMNELQAVAEVVSVGLGGGGDWNNWRNVLHIARLNPDCHINQPIETAGLTNQLLPETYTNALVRPTGKIGIVKLSSGDEITAEKAVDYCLSAGIPSIKFMSIEGTKHLDELIYLTKVAADKGIYGIEPAGGIGAENIHEITTAIKETGIPFYMPHIFGKTIDKTTGRTKPEEIEKIMAALEEK
ncbi:KDGP aldolase family protein [Listeria ivanovii]|uniref:KDGP aldolase n=1 Tax=Listeria ivanovii TaxID=1638 RepID=UPI0016240C82|nr:KDGP aldolase [Listeria ivanovii]MBC2256306.1 KDGP aldolase family protein [Listeria ivanovii]